MKEIINSIPEKIVVITKGLRASSPIYDYIFRPLKYSDMALYDWVQQFQKVKGGTKQINKKEAEFNDPDHCQQEDSHDQQEEHVGGKRKRDFEDGQDIMFDYSEMFLEGQSSTTNSSTTPSQA